VARKGKRKPGRQGRRVAPAGAQPAAAATNGRAAAAPSRRLALAAAIAAYALLLGAWAVGNPPFASPDESAHFVRAVALAGGELAGDPAELPVPPSATPRQRNVVAWGNRFAREVTVPGGLSPAGWECNWADASASAACQHDIVPDPSPTRLVTYVGSYHPLPYVAPGALARLGADPGAANRLGRVAAALSTGALLAVAILVLAAGAPVGAALLGPLAAITPMAVYFSAMLNPNGFEIAAGLALAASLLRLSRDDDPPRWAFAAVATTGVLLALARTPTPAWILLLALLFVAVRGARGTWRLLRAHPWASAATAVPVFLAVVANRAWERAHNPPLDVSIAGPGGGSGFSLDFGETRKVFSEVVAYFAYGEFAVPVVAHVAWWSLVAGIVLLALVVARWHGRAVLLGSLAAAVLLPPVMDELLRGFTNFFGRYFLAVLVAVPLLAGELVVRHHDRVRPALRRWTVVAFAAVAGAVHLTGWYANARRFAVGTDGPLWFATNAEWAPPLGWWPWLGAATLGAALLATAGVLAVSSRAWTRGPLTVAARLRGRGAVPAARP
jgi:hypothetical protein